MSKPITWLAASSGPDGVREAVAIGDYVALERHADSVGKIVGVAELDKPFVQLIEGPGRGRFVSVDAAEILLKVQR
jgi:hypothetical protein